MPASVLVVYPHASDATFNLQYYLNQHMPLVQSKFGPYGMKSWRVHKIVGTGSGDASPYSIHCSLAFESEKEIHDAFHAQAATVLGDVKNFSNKDPLIMIGEQAGSGP